MTVHLVIVTFLVKNIHCVTDMLTLDVAIRAQVRRVNYLTFLLIEICFQSFNLGKMMIT